MTFPTGDRGRQVRSRASVSLAMVAATVIIGSVVEPRSGVAQGGGPVEGYEFLISDATARPGERVEVDVDGLHARSAQGFSCALRFPAASLSVERVHIEDTILEAIDVDFFDVEIDPQEGWLTSGVLVDVLPPFDGGLIPAIGRPLTFLRLDVQVSDDASGDLVLELADGLGFPPIENHYVVDNEIVRVAGMRRGVIEVQRTVLAAFLRGDANLDQVVDLSDAVVILAYRFLGGVHPLCMDAADVDDDEEIQLTDAIFLLNHLFQGGRRPPAPGPTLAGSDPSGERLDCAVPLEWLEG